jgi:hypothetical protein
MEAFACHGHSGLISRKYHERRARCGFIRKGDCSYRPRFPLSFGAT